MHHTVIMAADHAGFELKEALKKYLVEQGHEIIDVGTFSKESVDYPDIVVLAAKEMKNNKDARGVFVCGSGMGISMAANRFPFIRAALCHTVSQIEGARQHNDANVVCLAGRVTAIKDAKAIVAALLTTPFDGGRHERRVDKLNKLQAMM